MHAEDCLNYNGSVNIKVKCIRPKYAKGEHQFATFQDFLSWLTRIKSLPRSSIGALIYGLAKDGFLGLHTGHYAIDVVSESYDYFLVGDLASRIGLLKTRWGSDYFSKKPEVALRFANELDKLRIQQA